MPSRPAPTPAPATARPRVPGGAHAPLTPARRHLRLGRHLHLLPGLGHGRPGGRRLLHIKVALVESCTNNVEELLKSLPGARVIKEVYALAPSETLANAIVDVCEESIDLFEDPVAHRSIKNLILCDVESDKPFVSKLLVDRLGKRLLDVAESNRGAFVAGALLKVPSVNDLVKKTFCSNKSKIEKNSKKKGSTAGYAALLKEISN